MKKADRVGVIRQELVKLIENSGRTGYRWSRRRIGMVGVAAGIVAGLGGLTAAAAGAFWPIDNDESLPGDDVLTILSADTLHEGSGSESLALPPVPEGASQVSVLFECQSPGRFTWGLVSAESATLVCDEPTSASADFVIPPGELQLIVDSSAQSSWSVVARFVSKEASPLAINSSGETFGSSTPGGAQPDLIAVFGIDADGETVAGYVRATELEQASLPGSIERTISVLDAEGEARLGSYTVVSSAGN